MVPYIQCTMCWLCIKIKMRAEYKDLLEANLVRLCEVVNPAQVLSRLLKSGIFKQYDVERVNHEVTSQEKTSLIIETLMDRSFEALSEFLCILASIDSSHYDLGREIQPVKHCVAWFTPSPAHAAAVVYALEEYAGAKFSKMARCGESKSLIVRRARVFPREFGKDEDPDNTIMPNDLDEDSLPLDTQEIIKSSHQTEVCLVFPTVNSDVSSVLESWFEEDLVGDADLILMSGECTGRRGRRRAVIATEVCGGVAGGERVCAGMGTEDMKSLEGHLSQVLKKRKEQWVERECGVTDSGPRPEVGFVRLSQQPSEASDLTDEGADCALCTANSLAFKFYQLCQRKHPIQPSLFCQGIPHDGTAGTESTAAVACSCLLMEVCKFYYHQTEYFIFL